MKSDIEKAKETLEKQGVKIEFKALDSESSKFMAQHIKTLYDTLPSDNDPDKQYFTMDDKQVTKDYLRKREIMDFKIKDIPSGEIVTCKDCCPVYDNPYGEVRSPITKERYKINMKNFDAWYAYDLSHGTQQMDPEMASYFQCKGIKTPDITADHITQMRKDLSRPWHETPDGRAQLISKEMHQRFRHPGGVSDAKFNVEMASRAEKLSSVDSSYLKSSFDKSSSSHTGKLFGGIGAAGAASGSSVNWGKIITSIIAVLVVLALIVGVVVLLAKVLPPVFEAIGNFFAAVGQFFVNMWNGICNFFSSIGQFFVNVWNGIVEFFTGPVPDSNIDLPDIDVPDIDVPGIGVDGFLDELFPNDSNNSTLIPHEEIRTYNIAYELDGGMNSVNNPETYDITVEVDYDKDGNEVETPYSFTASFNIDVLDIPTKEGYAFVGWYTDPDERIRDVKYGKDVTLYAVWTKINTIKLVYNENDVSEIKFVTDYPCEQFLNQVVNDPNFLYQVTYVDLPVFEDGPNYSFSGWFESADFDCEPTRTIYEEKDYTFYAGFENASPGLVFSKNFGGIVHYPVNDTENKILIDGYEGTDETVIIPQYYQGYKVAAIGNQAFYYTSAKAVLLSSSIEYIGNWAFIGNSIKTVYIPATVKEIDTDAFYDANGLTTIVFDGTKQQWNAYKVNYTYTDIQTIKCLDGNIVVGN